MITHNSRKSHVDFGVKRSVVKVTGQSNLHAPTNSFPIDTLVWSSQLYPSFTHVSVSRKITAMILGSKVQIPIHRAGLFTNLFLYKKSSLNYLTVFKPNMYIIYH